MDHDLQKKIIVSTSLIFLFALGMYTLYFSNDAKKAEDTPNSPKLLASQILTISNMKTPEGDSNTDGIPNWQENILGTDSGITKEDITAMQNASTSDISSKDKERLTDSNNITTALVKNNLAVASYARSVSSSTDIDYSGLSEDVLAQTLSTFSFKTYSEKDLTKIIETPYQTDRKKYGNELAQKTAEAIKLYIQIDEKLALKDLVDGKQDTDNIKNLKKKIAGITAFRDNLLSMSVPKDALSYHLGYVNAVERYLEVLTAFYGVNDDPLKAALMLRGYKDIVQSQLKFLSDFEDYFSKNNLIFNKNEYGYMFTVGIKR